VGCYLNTKLDEVNTRYLQKKKKTHGRISEGDFIISLLMRYFENIISSFIYLLTLKLGRVVHACNIALGRWK
jgi:hypothetical protein